MVSMTPDQFKKLSLGVIPSASPSPFFTPRPERYRMDYSRVSDVKSSMGYHRQDKDREVNVQVILRCRPLSNDEQSSNPSRVVTCNELKREVTISHSVANKQMDRLFTFDKVFGPKAQQRIIYDQAIAPIVREVLDGYNCTIFAYGQTGTGKTYTMEGSMKSKGTEVCAEAGVIPRAVRHLFDILEAQNADYSMKVSFLELYNEELTDLLTHEDNSRFSEDKQKKSVSLMEDGRGCVIIRGLEEEVVYSANDIYNLMERGAAKRRTADTLLNKRSSRSHSVFTIAVHVKDISIGEEELIKCGKLNLVDLAGSENISRSGVREGRAREAGEINKSLLTLGRVINALVEHSAHIPYRDSKLTRLLRDSLGGKTKTCIIATISPSSSCLEETLSTLDYAYRAKNIKNKPEANKKLCKTVLLKDLYMELERMKQDIRVARDKNGVYVPLERFVQDEAEKKGRIEKIEQLKMELEQSRKEVQKYHDLYVSEQEEKLDLDVELRDCKKNLESTCKVLHELQEKQKLSITQLQEKDSMISKLMYSENSLIQRAKELCCTLGNASEDISILHKKIDDKNKLENQNHKLVVTFGSQLDKNLKILHQTISGSISMQQDQLRCMEENLCSILASKDDATKNLQSTVQKLVDVHTSTMTSLRELNSTQQRTATADLEYVNSSISSQTVDMEKLFNSFIIDAKDVIYYIECSLSKQKELFLYSSQQQEQGLQKTLVSAQEINKATVAFFDEICSHASELISSLEESQARNHNYLKKFEKVFEEQSAKEEQQAIEKIVSALATLRTNKAALVSQELRNIYESGLEDSMESQKNLSRIQQASVAAKNALNGHVENVEGHVLTDLFLLTEINESMKEQIEQCSYQVNNSREQWKGAAHSIKKLNDDVKLRIQSTINERICQNEIAQSQYITTSSAKNAEFDAIVSSLLFKLKDTHTLDSEMKGKMNALSDQCINLLASVQTEHNKSLSTIQNKLASSLFKDYMVDEEASFEKRVVEVPSLASIEGLRTPAIAKLHADINAGERSEICVVETKTLQPLNYTTEWPSRAPFANIN
ncbi:kinesin-like protein KIN-5B [Chenopodium quinoa]|uniref:kinesin-like protein KIN-5B n=1 Tax=Chenopodium quinoa TaxID=63459 RepID=UPI000B786F00|nr:kinesin-like protein KIN-5B [Chenopodium quinoa]